MMFYPALAE